MKTKHTPPWVPLENIEPFVQLEPALFILGLAAGAWIGSKVFLKHLSAERKKNLRSQFKNLSFHLLTGIPIFILYLSLDRFFVVGPVMERIMSYMGLCLILSGAVIFVKTARIFAFEYLFLLHMRVAFPVLLVNLFTLLLSIILGAWIGAEIFNIRLAPLLATSAIFSLVLGLALQDTLGNLFAGVALQFDKPYEIGDWIEVQCTGQKWVGRVHEISWRATVLISFTEESITVPNRVMAQAQISNYATKTRPIIRSQIFRLPFQADIQQVKSILLKTVSAIPEIRRYPAPFTLISETSESWIAFKIVYYIDDFGSQYILADRVYTQVLTKLENAGLKLASHRITLTHDSQVEESAPNLIS